MRIIAGKFRSRKLVTLDGLATRPTLDYVKEAVFSSLGGYLTNDIILDVFGGSGALSLESISRGASHSTIIDANYAAIEIIKKNASNLGVQKQLSIIHGSYNMVLKQLTKQQFNVVFLDPPFRMKVIDEICQFLIENEMIVIGGYIVCEYPKADIVNKNYDGYRIKLCRKYASSEILILEREK